MRKDSIIIFGAGKGGKRGYNYLKRRYNIIGFSDNDKEKQNSAFCGYEVYRPDQLPALDFDKIVICSMYQSEIQYQLNSLGIFSEKIEVLPDGVLYGERNLLIGCSVIFAILTIGVLYSIYLLIKSLFF